MPATLGQRTVCRPSNRWLHPILVAAFVGLSLPGQAAGPAAQVEQDYREALEDLGRGHARIAEQKLQRALAAAPRDDDVRLTLADLLHDSDRRSSAATLLLEGFAHNPGRFALPLARMQFEDGRFRAVLETLGALPRHSAGNPWRDALEGAAAQQLGLHELAVEGFQRALALAPGNAAWAMALSESLTALGRQAAALALLQQTARTPNLQPEVREALGERIAALSERRPTRHD